MSARDTEQPTSVKTKPLLERVRDIAARDLRAREQRSTGTANIRLTCCAVSGTQALSRNIIAALATLNPLISVQQSVR